MTLAQAEAVLQVGRSWTLQDAKKAFKRLSRETHPDLGGDAEDFKQVAEAWQVLEEYSKTGRAPEEPRAGRPGSEPWDAWSETADWEEEEEEEDLGIGTWFDVLGVRVDGRRIEGTFRAQLVELREKGNNKYGEVIRTRYLIGVYPSSPVQMPGQLAEVVLKEAGIDQPSVFVRQIRQRVHERDGRISAFWFDPLDEPVVKEENIRSHGFYWGPSGDW